MNRPNFMKNWQLPSVARSLLAIVLIALGLPALAQTPAPVRILVGAPAGGSTDTLARSLATEMGRQLARPLPFS